SPRPSSAVHPAPSVRRRYVRNPLPAISRWKIFDNLRRSLVAPALVLLLAAGWLLLPGSPYFWTAAGLIAIAFPIYAHLASALLVDPRGVPWTSYFWGVWSDLLTNTKQVALSLAFLAHQGYLMLDAVVRTLRRVFFTRRNLLEWTTAADAERRLGTNLNGFWRRMWPAPALSSVLLAAILLLRREALPPALPFLLAWGLSPLLAWWVSRPPPARLQPVSAEDRALLRRVARKTWRFFEEFVGEGDNWLPPDNYQEDPSPQVTHRTSPTNIGLLLLSTLSARDLVYLTLTELADRLENTLETLAGMERYCGHFYNWYETIG